MELQAGNVESIRNYTDVRDIISAYLKVIECEPGIYNIAGNNTVSARWVLDKLASFVETPLKYEANEKLYRPMSLKFPSPNVEKLRTATGWTQEFDLDGTLEGILNYWRKIV